MTTQPANVSVTLAHQPGHRAGQAPAVSSLRPRQMVYDQLLRLARDPWPTRRIQLQPPVATPLHRRGSPRMVRARSRLRGEQSQLVTPADHRARGFRDCPGRCDSLAALPRQFHVPSLRRPQPSRDRRSMEQLRRGVQQPVRFPSRSWPHLRGPPTADIRRDSW